MATKILSKLLVDIYILNRHAYFTQIYGKRKGFNALVSLREKLAPTFHMIPFLFSPSPIKNRFSFIFSILTSRSNYNVKFKNDMVLQFKSSQFTDLSNLLHIIKLSTYVFYKFQRGNRIFLRSPK